VAPRAVLSILQPPTPPERVDAMRWTHTRARRRLMEGEWERDLDERVRKHVGHVRRNAWGPVDLSRNPYRVTCRALATLYDEGAPDLRNDQDAAALREAMAASGVWSTMPRHQSLTIGCRQYLMRVTATEDGKLRYRPVPPDLVVAESTMAAPEEPTRIAELRWMVDPKKPDDPAGGKWVWEVHDIQDLERPFHRVYVADRAGGIGEDVSASLMDGGAEEGDGYLDRLSDGTPILPWVIHHAERRGDRLWDPYDQRELMEGALNVGVLNSFWLHVVKDASWPQRYAAGARPVGSGVVETTGDATRSELVTDPAVLVVLELLPDQVGQAVIGQWEAGGDPKPLLEAIQSYGMDLAIDAGVSPSNIQRSEGPMSGFAISLNEQGKRQAQLRFREHFRWSDERMAAISAALLNRATGSALPESGYTAVYRTIPLSPEELRSKREHVLALMGAGLMSPIDAYLELHPELTRAQAKADLVRIGKERTQIAARAALEDPAADAGTV
jgi:hypothetical protein